uniref:Nuclear body protein SP140-like protein isoform X1 n=2 Tax=Callorhinus ursinus TaxID=34884 RepID=A0A3Q7QK14_CALUR|nr:nuclear body protein SP140-like protein isoform X1 [Callorhinus ursinus]XP_025746092.1 nuclear body protein SP140-like protein isoform X1 [Callorhinus ursinus]XP_025746102.1 nuclear body protein SP140-like protein isoform X1 [Callorhinus ursinus]XP_025746109.1 nuclear body protein SP140-like protein isoform X1 [Callorhinus ursinus]
MPCRCRRMFSMVQNEKISHEALLNHFKQNKVEIANAITKPFPFLESLRDRSFITEKIYKDSQEAHRNLVPVEKVVYNILCYLEKTFDRSLLQVLFSRVHLKEYPDLIPVHRLFENVIEDKYFPQKSDSKETQKTPNTGPSCEQVPDESKVLRMKERKSEKVCGLLDNGQGAELSRYELLVQSCARQLVDIQKTIASCHLKINQEGQSAGTAYVQVPEIIIISSESSEEEEPPAALSSAQGRGLEEEGEDGELSAADHQVSEFRAPAS